MSLHQDSDLWKIGQDQKLTELQFPESAVLIDVRQDTDDQRLIWNLAIELEDLSADMRLNQVYCWRYPVDCIDLLKLTPSRANELVQQRTDFILTTPTDQMRYFQGARDLVAYLCRDYIDRVRNNRISAVNGGISERTNRGSGQVDSKQATVRVMFLVDAENTVSLANAATYAQWIKEWYGDYEEPKRLNSDRRISTQAICVNADLHRLNPYAIAKYLNQTPGIHIPIDALILTPNYSDDETNFSDDHQSYQLELILYVLLLLPFDDLVTTDLDIVNNRTLSPNDFSEQTAPFWPIYLTGISSLEYSARWATRWLNYGLVAKIIRLIRDTTEVERDEELGLLSREVRAKLRQWQQDLNSIVPYDFIEVVPALQALKALQRYLSTSPFLEKKLSSTIEELKNFSERISQLYTGEGVTLESAIECASLIPGQIKRDAAENDLYQRLLALQYDAACLPAKLYHRAQGMLPRALQQITGLTELIEEIRNVAENPPDLKDCREKFDHEAKREQENLERLMKTSWPLLGGRHRLQREAAARRLNDIAFTHLNQVRSVITARVALILLQEAGLFDPDGKPCLYHRRLKALDETMRVAQEQAALQQRWAAERLMHSRSIPQGSASSSWLKLNSSRDLLQWDQIVESFDVWSKDLESTSSSLHLLMKWILQLMAAEMPSAITQQYLDESMQQLTGPEGREQRRLKAFCTMLTAVSLSSAFVGFKGPLLNQYVDLTNYFADASYVLENNNLKFLRHAAQESMSKATVGLLSNDYLNQTVTIEKILAAWVSVQYDGDTPYAQILEHKSISAHLLDLGLSPTHILEDLRKRNPLLGYLSSEISDALQSYLLLAPGEASSAFLRELNFLNSNQMHPVPFLDEEKLIFLQIHRIDQPRIGNLKDTIKRVVSKEHLLSLFAFSRATLENDDKALVGKTYTVEAGITQGSENSKPVPFDAAAREVDKHISFDVFIHLSKNIALTAEWHKTLLYNSRDQAPQLTEFKFQAVAPGPCIIVIDIYHERSRLITTRLEFDAIEESQPTTISSEV